MLSGARTITDRHIYRNISAHISYAGSGYFSCPVGDKGGLHKQLSYGKSDTHRYSKRRKRYVQADLRRSRTARKRSIFKLCGKCGHFNDNSGRGALHLSVGSGFPPQLHEYPAVYRKTTQTSCCNGVYRHRHGSGQAGHSKTAGNERPVHACYGL